MKWLSFVQTYLGPAVKSGELETWDDRHMSGGADWETEIERRLRACHVFVLLVSAHSMASNYIILHHRQGDCDRPRAAGKG